ncbi:class I SAM-dependent methyltransferase [Roseovarius pelagicus]|uniref:SAM-dependent methyltransferase n=1 Tax=Roseovarius pelagicus TaxID=2980108 RepID=A0ABY6D8B0_9RHOB|nr:SAM-dependent methyltransferase [Roseovarius pelagicus]UXX82149.1 SAM-dependent methyltransferase [Roseovarius pelagicus]
MTPLYRHLIAQIAETGPIPLADYMQTCLMHPDHGYYATRDPLGAAGDFITAPEISQMFGELLGLSIAQTWLDQGAPSAFALTELGPGRGTLMADMLRAAAKVPGFTAAAQVHLVEASPTLRAVQHETLQGTSVDWHDRLEDVPDLPIFLVANEFFDALPIRQMQRDGSGWRECCVGQQNGTLTFGLGACLPVPALEHRLADTNDGDIVELCPLGTSIANQIGHRIATHGGAALIVDYGDWHTLGDTFQALSGHAPTDPLAAPGNADLTAHVDFEALAQSAAPAAHSRLIPQGVFLERLGITPRAQTLANGMRGAALEAHIAAHRRLTHPEEMGTLFKVMALYPKDATPPPGCTQ